MSDVKNKFKIKHKDIIDELLLREISQGNEILEVLHDLKILSIPFKGYLSESDALSREEGVMSIIGPMRMEMLPPKLVVNLLS